MKLAKVFSAIAAVAVAVSAMAVSAVTASAEDSFTAALTFQTSSYKYRDTVAQESLLAWDDELGEAVDIEGATFTDATFSTNGTYTVTLKGIEDNGWNMLKLDTTIDIEAYPNVQITFDSLKINGAEATYDAPETSSYSNCWRAQLINTYDSVAIIPNETATDIELTFTVAGLPEAAAPVADAEAPAADVPAAEKGSPDTGVEGLAVVGAVALISAGALVVAKKRK